ncbi:MULTISPECIES: GvpL/GvpF family gas vesicle protein [Streptomyces]|uniref:GvpL/GvpF family gas vesicle protein n=1 Tax=Streptomyces lichenis TaxID=2306967 RepID=A0ABT0IDY3_9ACTN|nr:GvpL/GvpF family gas vesicle protein [Streptomyces lichenis]MCK8679541.1 GvpL/GvpF family gas vesicle protein [Streptomyces lichenis]
MAVYVYGITAAEPPPALDGAHGVGDPPRPLRTVAGGSLDAVVSDAPEELRAGRRDVRAHQDVLDRLSDHGGVLPLRFGTLAPDDEAVRRTLQERAPGYRERLAALDGCAEYHLRASHRPEKPTAAEEGARRDSLAAEVTAALGPLARESRSSDPTGEDVLNVSFLVAQDEQPAFLDREARLAVEHGASAFRFRLHGPLPPYSFV